MFYGICTALFLGTVIHELRAWAWTEVGILKGYYFIERAGGETDLLTVMEGISGSLDLSVSRLDIEQ